MAEKLATTKTARAQVKLQRLDTVEGRIASYSLVWSVRMRCVFVRVWTGGDKWSKA